MTLIQAIVLGLVQGLSEFIPISSTAHLRIVPALLGWGDPGAAASAVIQLGTLLAVLIYFARDIVKITKAFLAALLSGKPFETHDARLGWYIIAGSVPIVVIGLLLKDFIEGGARSLWIIAGSLIVLALFLWLAERVAAKSELRVIGDITLRDAILVGLAQCLALVPGASRSGTTIMMGLFRRLTHEAAARFSFLLSIPAIFGSGMFELFVEREHLAELGWLPIAVAIFVSFVSGWLSIYFLIRYLRTHTTGLFIIYRIVLGLVIIGLLLGGVLQPLG
ncbi:MAG: undecaprenyl-diphosphatase UppP [Acidobacteria bacterium]|nr:undecaprenyl-diphosphatase UppP [Acidobacteriota bacterium]